MPAPVRSPFERLEGKYARADVGCWYWTGTTAEKGYGRITGIPGERPRWLRAHRVMYEAMVGPVPEGLELDHLCGNPNCVRPDHLEAVTHAENMARGDRYGMGSHERAKTECPQGHPYDAENTMMTHRGTKRGCRACNREWSKRAYWRRKGL